MRSAVRLESIYKSYARVPVLSDFSLEAFDGEFLTLLGPSGCGKTTLLRIVAGLAFPDGGDVFIKDRRVTKLPAHQRNAAMVFQNYALFPHMSVFQNVAFGLRFRKVVGDELRRKVKESLSMVKLDGLDDRRPSQLSGGQQQRVALARALVLQPEVLLLDEPLSNLDRRLRVVMRLEVRRLQRDLGITTIFVTHDQEEALTMSDRLAVVNAGEVEQLGKPADIYEHPRTMFVADFIGETNFLKGRIEAIEDDIMRTSTTNGLELVALLPDEHRESFREGSPIRLTVRPETIALSKRSEQTPAKENILAGFVDDVIYQGQLILYVVRLTNGASLKVVDKNFGKAAFTLNENVLAKISPTHLCVIPEASDDAH